MNVQRGTLINHILVWSSVVGPLVLMALLAWTPGISFTEDLGRHLLLGQIISERHAVPTTNYLTYTHPDFPFVNHHWLSEVVLYQLHRRIGLNGLIVWKMLMMCAALAFAMATVRSSKFCPVYWAAGVLAPVMLGFRAHIRPELFTYLFIGLYLWLFERIRKGAQWPFFVILLTSVLWANLHIYFIFGLGMVAVFAFETWHRERSRVEGIRMLAWVAACTILSGVNPNGLRGLLYPLQIFTNYGIDITENASPLTYWRTVVNPMLLALPFMTFLVLASLPVTWKKHKDPERKRPLRLANIIIALTALLATWVMARSAPLLALAGFPVIAAAFAPREQCSLSAPRSKFKALSPGNVLACAAAVLNIWLAFAVVEGSYARIFPSPIGPTPFGFDDESRYRRLATLQREHSLTGPLFTDYNIGSLVEYELYPEPGYVDNRPEAFPAAFWRTEYLPALALTDTWAAVRDQRDINAIIVSLAGVKEAYCQELMRRPLWVLVHLDELSAVWVRNDVRNRQIIDDLVFDVDRCNTYETEIADAIAGLDQLPPWRRAVAADHIVYRLYSLICIGEVQHVWPHLLALHREYPDYQIVHELMRVSVPQEDIPIVEDVMRQRARRPLAAKQVLDWGHYLISKGDLDEARRVFRRGRLFFPLNPALPEAIKAVEDLEYQRGKDSSATHALQT